MRVVVLIMLALVAGCTSTRVAAPATANSLVVDGKIFTTVFQQKAAEYRALCYQAYNIAFLRLDQALTQPAVKPRAIITDIDETVLDNSVYAAHRGLQGKDYDLPSWIEYTAKAIADTIPGALNFLKYAAAQNVEVYYITNREAVERAGTLKNLQQFGFPFADEKHLLTKEGSSGKETRRLSIAKNYDIVLLLGDNLSDFSFLFDKKPTNERFDATNAVASLFGKSFIVLPNPVYGDWEGALSRFNYSLTPAQKDSLYKASMKSY